MADQSGKVRLTDFPGMDNVSKAPNQTKLKVILNMDTTGSGHLEKREGYIKEEINERFTHIKDGVGLTGREQRFDKSLKDLVDKLLETK